MLGGSNTKRVTIDDFSQPIDHAFEIEIGENEFIYKYKLQITGQVDGELIFNEYDTLRGAINDTKHGDWYQPSYTLRLEPIGEDVKGKLDFKLKMYY